MGKDVLDRAAWNGLIAALPGGHILQTWEWGQFKERYGWKAIRQVWRDPQGQLLAAALVLKRSLPFRRLGAPLHVLYVPKGPLLQDWADSGLRHRVLNDLRELAERQGAIFIKIDPDVRLATGTPDTAGPLTDQSGKALLPDLQALGWRFSAEQVQFRNTILVDLDPSPDELLARMKPKTRYNIRLAMRKGVLVRPGTLEDLDLLYQMYAETSLRDGFVIRGRDYYQAAWGTFMQAGLAEPLIAEVEDQPTAAVIVYRFADKAWYMYGMSREAHREKMPNQLLQWEAMLRARATGCRLYDLWGAPDEFVESDPLWGVYRFKEGLGGRVVRHIGAWDLPVRPVSYWLYMQVLPRFLTLMRRRGFARTRGEMGIT